MNTLHKKVFLIAKKKLDCYIEDLKHHRYTIKNIKYVDMEYDYTSHQYCIYYSIQYISSTKGGNMPITLRVTSEEIKNEEVVSVTKNTYKELLTEKLVEKYVKNALRKLTYGFKIDNELQLLQVENFCTKNNISYISMPQEMKIEIDEKHTEKETNKVSKFILDNELFRRY